MTAGFAANRACIAEVSERLERRPPRIAPAAEDALVRYHWPGNVRELRHVLERLLLAGVGDEITADALPAEILEGKEAYLAPGVDKRPTLEDVERRYIELTLAYAVSIHKSQGSEYPCVVLPLHTQHYALLQRNLLYTGVTRGKRLVVVVGSKRALGIAVKNGTRDARFTRLADRLQLSS